MKQVIIILFFGSLCFTTLSAQSAISANAGQGIYEEMIVDWAVGDLIIGTFYPSKETEELTISTTTVYANASNQQIDNSTRLHLFPNPTRDGLTIRFNDFQVPLITIRILTTTGQEVLRQQFSNGEQEAWVDVSDLTPGAYIVHALHNNAQLVVEKLFIH